MLDSFSILTPAGRLECYHPALPAGPNKTRWIKETPGGDKDAPIEVRVLKNSARRREVIAAFRK